MQHLSMALLVTVFTEALQMLVQISLPIVFLTFSDFVQVYRALYIYYSMHLVEYVILYQPVLCLRFKSRVMQLSEHYF